MSPSPSQVLRICHTTADFTSVPSVPLRAVPRRRRRKEEEAYVSIRQHTSAEEEEETAAKALPRQRRAGAMRPDAGVGGAGVTLWDHACAQHERADVGGECHAVGGGHACARQSQRSRGGGGGDDEEGTRETRAHVGHTRARVAGETCAQACVLRCGEAEGGGGGCVGGEAAGEECYSSSTASSSDSSSPCPSHSLSPSDEELLKVKRATKACKGTY
jgi:hypothetical protein